MIGAGRPHKTRTDFRFKMLQSGISGALPLVPARGSRICAGMGYTVHEIAAALTARFEGDGDLLIRRPVEPAAATADDLALAMDPRFGEQITDGHARAAILWDGADWKGMGLSAAIFVPRPRFAMSGVTALFDPGRQIAPGIHASAIIDPSAQIADDVHIGAFAIIGAHAVIGPRSRIFAHASVAERAELGADCQLLEGARIGANVRLGARVSVHQNAVVGADGFSYVTPEAGAIDQMKAEGQVSKLHKEQQFARIHSLGSVVVGDDVEIGANAAIDRGTVRDTTIGAGTKIDNLVHVGHNVSVGRVCLLCGQVGVAGSAVVGDRVVLGGQVGVADHVSIGHDVIVAGKAGVSSNIPPNRVMMGNPAIPMESNIESYKLYRRLPRLAAKVAELQKQVSKLGPKR